MGVPPVVQLDLSDPHACRYCGVADGNERPHECDVGAMKAVIDAEQERWAETRKLALELIGRLDVMMPKVEGVIGFQSLRAGGAQVYDGPDPYPWIEKLREHCRLTDQGPATERDFWPEDYCKTCDGSGMVMPQEGTLPQGASLQLCIRAVPDRAAAYRLLRALDPKLPATEAWAILDKMPEEPMPVLSKGNGKDWHEAPVVHAWTELGAEFAYVRSIVWPCYDICPDCNGTANRGLQEGHPFEFNSLWPEAPVELLMHERNVDGTMQVMPREELERLFKVFSRRESSDG